MTWTSLFGLIVCNAIWATNPTMGKILLVRHSPLEVSWLRYSSALATACLIVLLLRKVRPRELSSWRDCVSRRNLYWLLALGGITFFGSAIVQYLGLSRSTSMANALIVAMEPLFAVVLAWLFLGEAMGLRQILTFAIAVAGFCLMSNLKPADIAGSVSLFNVGNLFFLVAMPMEAMYSIISRKLVGRIQPVSIFASALPFGCALLCAYVWIRGEGFPSFIGLSWLESFAVLWLGPIGTTVTYIFWTIVLVHTPVAAVSLTLFVQPILGALMGTFFLGERFDRWQILGAACIVGALCLQTQLALRAGNKKKYSFMR